MSIKEDLKSIKQEISIQEQFLGNLIKSEKFLKKNKILLIIILLSILITVILYFTNKTIDANKKKEANLAYNALILNPNDKKNKEILENKNPSLYALFNFAQIMKANNTKESEEKNKIKFLENLSIDPTLKEIFNAYLGEDSNILKDYQILLKGFNYQKNNEIEKANKEFNKIAENSLFSNLIKNLKHYQGIKK